MLYICHCHVVTIFVRTKRMLSGHYLKTKLLTVTVHYNDVCLFGASDSALLLTLCALQITILLLLLLLLFVCKSPNYKQSYGTIEYLLDVHSVN